MADSSNKGKEEKKNNKTEQKKDAKAKSTNAKSAGAKSSGAKGSAKSTNAKAQGLKKSSKEGEDIKIKKNPAGSRLRDEVTSVILVALGIFLILSVMTTATGKFGMVLSSVLKGCFGMMAYVLPFYIIIYALLVLMDKMARINSRTVFFIFLMYIDLAMLNSARFEDVHDAFGLGYIKDMYTLGCSLKSAGAVGMTLGNLVVRYVDVAGLIILGIALFIVSAMLLINTPISMFFDMRREEREQKKAEALKAANAGSAGADNGAGLGANGGTIDGKKVMVNQQLGMDMTEVVKDSKRKRDKHKSDKAAAGIEPADSEKKADAAATDIAELRIKGTQSFSENENFYGQTDTPDTPITENKRQILEYMNDENLFSGGADVSGAADAEFYYFEKASDTAAGDAASAGISNDRDTLESDTSLDYGGAASSPGGLAGTTAGPDTAGAGTSGTFADVNSSGDDDSFTQQALDMASQEKKLTKSEAKAVVTQGAALVDAEIKQNSGEKKEYRLPPIDLLQSVKKKTDRNEERLLRQKSEHLEQVLHDFGVNARVIDVKKGPAVTRYEIQPATGVKVNSIVRLADDIALNLEAKSLRIEAPIPGKAAVGIEVENDSSIVVTLREMIESEEFKAAKSKISFVVGEDISGNHVVADLKGMPHLLIAGSTGSGKSVCINSIIMSMLYNATPDEVKFILIDPKVVELGNYNGIPHMLIPVVTDPSKAAAALAWAVQEMNDRYRKFAETNVRDLKSYNDKMKKDGEDEKVLPQIVIIIDELADLMMAAAKQVEESICRLAQLARAAGMHLVVATQRPSVDVVTGLIKANIPSRIAFAVSSQVDSRTILDRAGAEKLVGKGDMLFYPLGKAQPERLQGPFVTDDEVNAVIDFWKAQADEGDGGASIMEAINTSIKTEYAEEEDEEDELFADAVDLVIDTGHASASMLQRRFRIGYNRAGRLIDVMEARGIIGPSEGSKPRRVLVTREEYEGKDAVREDVDAHPDFSSEIASDDAEVASDAYSYQEENDSSAEPVDDYRYDPYTDSEN